MKKKLKRKMMDTATFLKKLAGLKKRGWWELQHGPIRCKDGWCPIIALYPRRARFTSNEEVYQAARALGIPSRLANRIVEAADNPYDSSPSRALRRKMKAALGLV